MIADIQSFQYLLEKNLELKIKEYDVKSAELKKAPLTSSFLPRTYLFAGLENEKEKRVNRTGTGSGIGFDLNLFSGFRDFYETKLNNTHYDAESISHKIVLRNLLLKCRELYYDLLRTSEIEKILGEEVLANQANKEVIRKKISGGVISSKELLENTLYELESNEQLYQNKMQHNQIQLEFTQIMNDPSFLVHVNPLVLSSGLGDVPGERLSILQEKHNVLLADAANLEKSKWGFSSKFKLNFFGEYAFSKNHLGEIVNESIAADRIIGLRLIFNLTEEKNQRSIEQQVLSVEQEKQRLQVEQLKAQNDFKRKDLTAQLEQVEKRIEFFSEKIKVLTELYQVTLSGFRVGTKDVSALNDVTRRLFSAKKELISQKVDKLKILDQINL